MLHRCVSMAVAVRPLRHRIMRVIVVSIVMAMGVFMLRRFVGVRVRV